MDKPNTTIKEIEKQVDETLKGYVNTNVVVASTVVTGVTMYLVGRNKALKMGYAQGRAEGYGQALTDVAGLIKQFTVHMR